MAELVVTNARLLDGRLVHLGISGGVYETIAAEAIPGEQVIDAAGGLVTETFVNGHLHLDKVHTLQMAGEGALGAYTGADMGAAMRSIVTDASAVKKHYDREWIMPNVRKVLDQAVVNGVLQLQAFVDVDTTAGLEGMHAVLAVRAEYRDLLDLQVVAFPQDGVLRDPGAAQLCEQAIELGADVVGGIPWIELTDADARAHIDWACALAARTGKRVAMLTDDAGDSSLRTTAMLAQALIEHDLIGRGVACHARAVGLYPVPSQLRLVDLARKAGLGFVSDPHTGPLYLPVRQFYDDDLPVALGQDDIEDAYYPFGRNNMLEVAFLGAHLLEFRTAADQLALLDLVTTRAARVLGQTDHRIAVGNPANLCVHQAVSVRDLLTEHQPPAVVLRRGRPVARSESSSVVLRP